MTIKILLAVSIFTLGTITVTDALALGVCCTDLEERVAELEATIGSSDGLVMGDDGTTIVAADQFSQNATLLAIINPDGEVETSSEESVGSNPVIFSFLQSVGTSNDGPSVTTGGINSQGGLNTRTVPVSGDAPQYLSDIRDTWDELRADFNDLACDIVRIKVNTVFASPVSPQHELHSRLVFDNAGQDGFPGLDVLFVRLHYVVVHCSNGESYATTLAISVPDPRMPNVIESDISPPQQINPPTQNGSAGTKGGALPGIALPPGSGTLTHGTQPVVAYFGFSPANGSPVPVLVYQDAHLNPVDSIILNGPAASFGSDLALCGHPNYAHLWLAWTAESGNGQLAYIVDGQASVTDLGQSGGQVALTCDTWGNAVVGQTSLNGSQITLAAFDPANSSSGTIQFATEGGFTGMTLALDMNSNGEIAIAWRTLSATTIVARATLPDVSPVDLSYSGSWHSPFFDGEGFIWDVAEINGAPTLVLYYFTYRPNTSGRQAWVVGSAPILNGIATVPVAITNGATFGIAYDPDSVNTNVWGEIEVRVLDCRLARMIMRSPLFGDHEYVVRKFTAPPAGLAAGCPGEPVIVSKGQGDIDGSYGGSYFSPQRNFEGFIIDVTKSGGETTAVVYWFTYTPDGNGRQMWLVGAAPVQGESVSVQLVRTEGGQYGENFDPDAVAASSFTTATITWSDCDSASVMYQVDGGESGSFDVQRLASLPTGAGGICGT